MMAGREIIMAVDGGGSRCRVRLVDRQGQPLALATGGEANVRSDMQKACHNILETMDRAWRQLGLDPAQCQPAAAVLGLAGAEEDAVARRAQKALGIARSRVVGDRRTTLEGALGGGDGTLALTGTGSFFARRAQGRITSIGGWGFVLGDECSGAWLGRELYRAALLAEDGLIDHSPLTRSVMARFHGSGKALVRFADAASPGEIAAIAPRIIAAERDGDPVAGRIMADAVRLYCARLDRLDRLGGGGNLYLVGGLAGAYGERLPERFRRRIRPAHGSPLDGAVGLALGLLAELEAGQQG